MAEKQKWAQPAYDSYSGDYEMNKAKWSKPECEKVRLVAE